MTFLQEMVDLFEMLNAFLYCLLFEIWSLAERLSYHVIFIAGELWSFPGL